MNSLIDLEIFHKDLNMPLMNFLIFHEISENILKILLKRRYLNLHNRKMVLIIKSLKKFKDTLKAFNDFKIKQESVRSNVFWYVRVYIFRNCIIYTIQWDKIQMLKKFLLQKMPFFFFCELQIIIVFLLIYDSYMSWSTRFVSRKQCVGFSIFDSVSIL